MDKYLQMFIAVLLLITKRASSLHVQKWGWVGWRIIQGAHTEYSVIFFVVIVQLLSGVRLFMTPWSAAGQAPLSSTISQSLLKFMSIELQRLSNHLILFCPLLLLPSIFPSIKVFSSESALHIRWPKYWSFCISLSSEYSGLISFRIDWYDLLAVQGLLRVFSSTI